MLLRPPNFSPRRFQPLRPPLERDGHRGIHPVKVLQEVGPGGGWGREQGIENEGFAVEPEVTAFGFEFRDGQPPVHPAPRRPRPRRCRAGSRVRSTPGTPGARPATATASGHRPGRGMLPPSAGIRPPPHRCSSGGTRIHVCSAAAPSSSSHRPSTTVRLCARPQPSTAPDRAPMRHKRSSPAPVRRGRRGVSPSPALPHRCLPRRCSENRWPGKTDRSRAGSGNRVRSTSAASGPGCDPSRPGFAHRGRWGKAAPCSRVPRFASGKSGHHRAIPNRAAHRPAIPPPRSPGVQGSY